MSRYTGTNYRKLSDAKRPVLSASNSPLMDEAELAYPIPDSKPLTIDDFSHAYRFLLTTDRRLTDKQLDSFIQTYYSHISAECVAYIVSTSYTYVPEPADQAEVEAAAIARIEEYLTGKGE